MLPRIQTSYVTSCIVTKVSLLSTIGLYELEEISVHQFSFDLIELHVGIYNYHCHVLGLL